MATAAVTHNFVNGTTADADDVDTNFDDLVSFINTNAIQKDGSKAMTAALTLSGNPTNDNHAVRKAYMDGPYVRVHTATSQSFTPNTWTTVKFTTEARDTATAYDLTTGLFTVPTTGVYQVSWALSPDSDESVRYGMRIVADGTAYDGTRYVPNQVADDAISEGAVTTMSASVYVTAASTIAPQVIIAAGGVVSRSLGLWMTISWMHA